jgi:hypothetical protein
LKIEEVYEKESSAIEEQISSLECEAELLGMGLENATAHASCQMLLTAGDPRSTLPGTRRIGQLNIYDL